jgi:hypothetical protein
MMDEQALDRLQVKTPEQKFLHTLTSEFHYAPKSAEAILQEARSCLIGEPHCLRAGQMRVILARRRAGTGQALTDTPRVEVTWTVDAGAEDLDVLRKWGSRQLRWVRIQRLLDEAIEQGGVASQEDLARGLQTSLRTIKRDFEQMHASGVHLPSRGYLHGVGRGQTHKALVIRRWLQGETYDQLSVKTHHSCQSIRRYIRAFLQVVELHRRGFADCQISLLLQIGLPLTQEYLEVYRQNDAPACRERLEEQLQRVQRGDGLEKGAR